MVAVRLCPIGATAVRVPPGWRGLLALVLLIAVGVPLGAQPRQEQDLVRRPGKPDIDTTVTQPKRVQVVDDQNRPLADAQVRVGWWEDEDGDVLGQIIVDPPRTNAEGQVIIQVPRGAVHAQISAVAKGYAVGGKQYSLAGEPKIALKRGQIVRVRAVDAEGAPLPDAVPLLQDSRVWPHEFQPDAADPGRFVSPVVDPERRWLRVVDTDDEGHFRFSELIDVYQPQQVDELGDIVAVLRRGIRLTGKLDDSVPRPIGGGCVELYIKQAEAHRIDRGGWSWQDSAPVAEDGTFVFESLPTGGHVQLVAVVDGYQSTRPSAESLSAYLLEHDAGEVELLNSLVDRHDSFWPHLFPLPIDQGNVHVELPCMPTASVEVEVVDPLGQPLEGAVVKFNPNGNFVGGKLFIPGSTGFTEPARVRKNNDRLAEVRKWAANTFLRVETNAQGVAQVRSLPGDDRQSYRVEAEGYVMPLHPTSSVEDDSRFALVELIGGQTHKRTITMERPVPRGVRKLTILEGQGNPQEGITVTVTEIAFEGMDEDWHLWSTARFGPVPSATTTADGEIALHVPQQVEGRSITRLRLFLRGRIGSNASLYQELVVPARPDGKVIGLTVSQEPPKAHSLRGVEARYVDPQVVFQQSPQQLLARLIEAPSLILLKQLLETNQFSDATPLELRPEANSLQGNDPSPIAQIDTDQGKRVVVLCRVRPADATWENKPGLHSPPDAAFIFSAEDGSLQGMVGGWSSSKGSTCRLLLTDLGPAHDYFLQASAYEDNGPFNYVHRWTLVSRPEVPALTVFGHSNDPAWSADSHQSDLLSAEFGYLEYRGESGRRDRGEPGWLENGAKVPRKIYWDGESNQFVGLQQMWLKSQPLYQVNVDSSAAFQGLKISPHELVVGGGKRSYQNWHAWDVAIPSGKAARLRLMLIRREASEEADAAEMVVQELRSRPLPPGLHFVQLQIRDDQEEKERSVVVLRTDSEKQEDWPEHSVPRISVEQTRSVPEGAVLRTASGSIDLLLRPTADDDVWLAWRLTAQ